jgi:MFS transporter, SP family, solute carrier family 2 (myo-inositol transporter), member 13
MEGGVTTVADKAEFKECLRLAWTQPYILQLVLSAGIGGLLFGYDTGNLYCRRHDSLVRDRL